MPNMRTARCLGPGRSDLRPCVGSPPQANEGILRPTADALEPEVRAILKNEPGVLGGMMRATLYPYKIAYLHRG